MKKIFLILTLLIIWSCNTTEPIVEKNITISEIDCAVREVYIRLAFETASNRDLILTRNEQIIKNFSCSQIDTIIVDTSLEPQTSYCYVIKEIVRGKIVSESNSINITTLPPSRHDFTWNFYTLESPGGTGYFSDVTIVHENDVWVCGELWTNDSGGSSNFTKKNIAHWDGNQWILETVNFKYYYGSGPSKPTSILSFNSNDILLSSAGSVMRFNGKTWNSLGLLSNTNSTIGTITAMAGLSSGDFYGAGYDGSLVHWDGSNWKKINIELTSDILDIQLIDNLTNLFYLTTLTEESFELLFVEAEKIKERKSVLNEGPLSVWTNRGFPIYTGGTSLFSNKTGLWQKEDNVPQIYYPTVVGNGLNDIFIVGQSIAHFNGVDWKTFPELYDVSTIFYSVCVKGNLLVAVGTREGKGVVIIGKRD